MLVALIVPTAAGLTLVMLKAVNAFPDEGATLKTGVTVASPDSVTVVDALEALPKVASPAGDALHVENTYPEPGVALIAVAAPVLTVSACAGCMLPYAVLPGVNVTLFGGEEGDGDVPGWVQEATRTVVAIAARKISEVLTTRSSKDVGILDTAFPVRGSISSPDTGRRVAVADRGATVDV